MKSSAVKSDLVEFLFIFFLDFLELFKLFRTCVKNPLRPLMIFKLSFHFKNVIPVENAIWSCSQISFRNSLERVKFTVTLFTILTE